MILVDVYVPSMDTEYDFQVEETATIANVIAEMAEMIGAQTKTTDGLEIEKFTLCCMDRNRILQKSATLQSYGIVNGSRLMLV